jgi:5'-phosphate synthase pdxT subunit
MKVGVVALQGAVSEHIDAVKRAFLEMELEGEVGIIRNKSDLESCQGLIIPGGESTTISRLLSSTGMTKEIKKMVEEGMPIMGTCTGCILLAKEGDEEVEKSQTELLGLMDMKVVRNAFGRQRESFETQLDIDGLEKQYRGVFIRAPAIVKVWGECKALARLEGKIVCAQQKNLLACAFHPELTKDSRIHDMLLDMILRHDYKP